MGVGKSSVGKLLAEKLGYSYLDTDELIEKTEGRKISEIFKKDKEEYFRNLETEVLRTLEDYENFVLSTGGGIVLKPENVRLLKEMGKVILLSADPKVIFERIKDLKDRPLVESKDKKEKIIALLQKREMIYNTACDCNIDTTNKTIEQVSEEILKYAKA